MSLYNDPRNFQTYRADLSSQVKQFVSDATQVEQPVQSANELTSQLDFLSDPNNFAHLTHLKAVDDEQLVTCQTKLSVHKIKEGFVGFGFPDEGRMVEELLLGIGQDDQNLGPIFTPNDIKNYKDKLLSTEDSFDPAFIDMLTKALQPD